MSKQTKAQEEFIEDFNNKITNINHEAYLLILNLHYVCSDAVNRIKAYHKNGKDWVAIDNSTGDMWVESFSTRRKAINYLLGKE